MAHRALIEHRPWLTISILSAIAYYFLADVSSEPIQGVMQIGLKGAGVGLLAVYALRRTRGLDGALLTLVMALGAAADMVLIINFTMGGVLFFCAHAVAICLLLRHRNAALSPTRVAAAAAAIIGTPTISYLLSEDILVALYATGLGVMAAAACISRFPMVRVGLGAALFIISDWLIFSRMGPIDLGILPDLLIWPTYYSAQLMIATGVVQTLRSQWPIQEDAGD